MESLQNLANESFSYSWLLNVKPSHSLDSLRASFDASDDASSFIDMDPKMSSSFNFMKRPPSSDYSLDPDFNFNFPKSHPLLPLADADQIFSNGLLLPDLHHRRRLNMNCLEQEVVDEMTSCGKLVVSHGRGRGQRSWSKKMVRKYLGFLRPLYRRLMSRKMMSSGQGKVGPTSFSCPPSSMTTPRSSTSDLHLHHHNFFLKNSDQEEISIYEAVLHCKKSNEKGQVPDRNLHQKEQHG